MTPSAKSQRILRTKPAYRDKQNRFARERNEKNTVIIFLEKQGENKFSKYETLRQHAIKFIIEV